MQRDSSAFETSSSSDISAGSSAPITSGRKPARKQNSDTTWNWVLILALLGTIFYFWIFPLQFPRKPLKVIFENGTSSTQRGSTIAGTDATGGAAQEAPTTAPSDGDRSQQPTTSQGSTEPENGSQPTR